MSKVQQKIPVRDLRLGMYVVKLDRPWISTPFDPQGFPIRSLVQVELLAKYCKSVHVAGVAKRNVRRTGAKPRTVASVRKTIRLVKAKAATRKPAAARGRRKTVARAR